MSPTRLPDFFLTASDGLSINVAHLRQFLMDESGAPLIALRYSRGLSENPRDSVMRDPTPITLIESIERLILTGASPVQVRLQLQLLKQKVQALEYQFAQIQVDRNDIMALLAETKKQLEESERPDDS